MRNNFENAPFLKQEDANILRKMISERLGAKNQKDLKDKTLNSWGQNRENSYTGGTKRKLVCFGV